MHATPRRETRCAQGGWLRVVEARDRDRDGVDGPINQSPKPPLVHDRLGPGLPAQPEASLVRCGQHDAGPKAADPIIDDVVAASLKLARSSSSDQQDNCGLPY